MKIVFIDSFYISKEKRLKCSGLGIISIGTILKNEGHDIDIIFPHNLFFKNELFEKDPIRKSIDSLVSIIEEKDPEVVGLYGICNTYHINLKIAEKIKKRNKNVKIIFGGPHATATAKLSMDAFPFIDIIVKGEAEAMIGDLVSAIEKKSSLCDIPAIVYRKDGKIVENEKIKLIDDLDQLPVPDYSLVDDFDKMSIVPIDPGRGCPFNCHFCSTSRFWKKKFRMKSVERLVDEIELLHKKHNKRIFSFLHDNFTFDKKIVIEFCDLLIEKELKIKWFCSARIDTLDKEMIFKMKKAGCHAIFTGVETGSPRMQRIINKNIDLEKAWENFKILDQVGINFNISLIYGFPEETEEDFNQTLRFLIKLFTLESMMRANLMYFRIMHGTKYYEKYFDESAKLLSVDEKKDPLLSSLIISKKSFLFGEKLFSDFREIFSHFYKVNNLFDDFGQSFDAFHHVLIRSLTRNYKKTLDKVLIFYEDSPIEFYRDLENFEPNFTGSKINNIFRNFMEQDRGDDRKWKEAQKQFEVELRKNKNKFLKSLGGRKTSKKIKDFNKRKKTEKGTYKRIDVVIEEIKNGKIKAKDTRKEEEKTLSFNSETLFIETYLLEEDFSEKNKEVDFKKMRRGDEVTVFGNEKDGKLECLLVKKIIALDKLFIRP